MARPAVRLASLRFVLGAALLGFVGALSMSCVEALDADGYRDTFAEACDLVQQCYGPDFAECSARVGAIEDFEREVDWLERVDNSSCLDSCKLLYQCLDFPPICVGALGVADVCAIDQDCCGFSDGTTVCSGGYCCRPLGTECTSDYDCCPGAELCINGTCGGVKCATAGDVCLNDFQCCSGRCSDASVCEELPCPPEGFPCESDAECCDLLCVGEGDDKRCTDPACAQKGESCITDDDCCDDGFICNTKGGMGGVCNDEECNPDNSDCNAPDDCCPGSTCIEHYNLCGKCVLEGAACSAAVPCCTGLGCFDGACEVCVAKGEPCAMTQCCVGLECNGAVCVDLAP